MFDIGWSELLIIAVVAIVVVGPKDLPRLMRTFGHYAGKLRRAAADFQRQFEDAMRETELEEVKKAIDSVRSTETIVDLQAPIDKPIMLPNPRHTIRHHRRLSVLPSPNPLRPKPQLRRPRPQRHRGPASRRQSPSRDP